VARICVSPPAAQYSRNATLGAGIGRPVISKAAMNSTSAVGAPYRKRTKPAPLTDNRWRSFCCMAVRQHWNNAADTVMGIHTGMARCSSVRLQPERSGDVDARV
jgi:hypothetical protein